MKIALSANKPLEQIEEEIERDVNATEKDDDLEEDESTDSEILQLEMLDQEEL